ncbi:DUF2182 domain-containing protein [Amorphus sp. 3PC139-8]|uniref:DUF2182 domain-containing protein n=1 Tax=Amorphus sp. 3PC139-8 TaxID=2735676 RepID=UPI00345D2A9E
MTARTRQSVSSDARTGAATPDLEPVKPLLTPKRGRVLVIVAVALAALIGWLYLAATVMAVPEALRSALGPGMNLLNVGGSPQVPAFLTALCAPVTLANGIDPTTVAVTVAMWAAMVFAMMLPTAVPMFTTYAAIAGRARRNGERVPSMGLLGAGYVSVWVAFAVVAGAAQLGLVALGTMSPAMTPLAPALAGTTLMAAGLYQLTPAKYACLTRCRAPFSILASRWRTTDYGMFRLGLEEGVYCLGCCWALMVVMFAVGVMNVVWMAIFTVLMVAEKAGSGRALPRGIGIALLLWGAMLFTLSEPGRRLLGL